MDSNQRKTLKNSIIEFYKIKASFTPTKHGKIVVLARLDFMN